MLIFEDIKAGAELKGPAPNGPASVVAVTPVGPDSITVVYKLHSGAIKEQLWYRDCEERLSIARAGLAWSFDSPSKNFKPVPVFVDGSQVEGHYYIRAPFEHEPDRAQDSVNYNINGLLSRAVKPEEAV